MGFAAVGVAEMLHRTAMKSGAVVVDFASASRRAVASVYTRGGDDGTVFDERRRSPCQVQGGNCDTVGSGGFSEEEESAPSFSALQRLGQEAAQGLQCVFLCDDELF